MPQAPRFPHLHLTFRGSLKPNFGGFGSQNTEVTLAKNNPQAHAAKLRLSLEQLRAIYAESKISREAEGLPPIPADKGFLLRLPDNVDADAFTKALGVELVAEAEEGLMLVSSQSIEFARLEEVLSAFELGQRGGGYGASILDIYSEPSDERRLRNVLAPEVFEQWPFQDDSSYTFDLGIQTALSTRTVKWPPVRRKKGEPDADFQNRKEEIRHRAWIESDQDWSEKGETRYDELQQFIQHYQGIITSALISEESQKNERGITFPDSVQVRVEMNGKGFRDVVLNFAHLFDVSFPPELASLQGVVEGESELGAIELQAPGVGIPAVCVIDSGIQEEHLWLKAAMDQRSSRCFIPGENPNDVADYVPQGHGTRVAGAILYPRQIPKSGTVEPVAWLQNARVLNANNTLSDKLPPERYLQKVVDHFKATPHSTRIYNHSINAKIPCSGARMSAWATKIDQLSHEKDVLFIQSAGNQRHGVGDTRNPGLQSHLEAGREPPTHMLENSMRVANPAQSLHALVVGSVSESVFEDEYCRSFAKVQFQPSGFTRSGYSRPWSVVKPEVVEMGGDLVYSKSPPMLVRRHPSVSIELLNSTLNGSPAHSIDGVGTSYAAPKVAHIAASLQQLFPTASPLLYRALIVQSARWPAWAETETDCDKVLRLIGYGIPSIERASENATHRVTMIMPDAEMIGSKQLHLYTVRIPEELRQAALEARIRIDITLAYTALPRRAVVPEKRTRG